MMTLSFVLLTVLVLFLTAVAIALTLEFRRLERAGAMVRSAVEIGAIAPALVGVSLDAGTVVSIKPGREPSLVLFVSTTCSKCRALVPAIQLDMLAARSIERFVLVCCGSEGECRASFESASRKWSSGLIDATQECQRSYGVGSFPTAVLLDNGLVQRYAHPLNAAELVEIVSLPRRPKAAPVVERGKGFAPTSQL